MDIPEYKKNRVLQYWMKEDFVAGDMSSPLPKGLLLQESLLHEVVEGVTSPREGEHMSLGSTPGRELVSWAARHMSLSPSYSIRRAFDFE